MFAAGRLNQRITIQQPAASQDAYGEMVPSWTTFATVWAEVKPVLGSEAVVNGMTLAQAPVKVRIRHLAGVLPTMRVVHETRTLAVRSVAEMDSAGQIDELLCEVIDGGS